MGQACKRLSVLFSIMVCINSLFAAPMVQVDSLDVNVGGIKQGKTKQLRHVFTIKNIGDKPLVLKSVRPG